MTGGLGVRCEGVVLIYPVEGNDVVALAGVDLDVRPGESLALLGPSGCGKSSLLSVLAGLLRPSAGRLRVGDRDLTKATERDLRRMRATEVGVVLQGAARNLLPYEDAEGNVRFAQAAVPAERRRVLPRPAAVLELLGLTDVRRRPLADLTPGQRQRVAVAVGMSAMPGVLLADEPTSQLDSAARDEVLAALRTVHQEQGSTVVVVTHDPEVSARLGRTVSMRDGRVGAEGRHGEEFAVVGRDGAVHLPLDVLATVPPGTLLRVRTDEDGSVRLTPSGEV